MASRANAHTRKAKGFDNQLPCHAIPLESASFRSRARENAFKTSFHDAHFEAIHENPLIKVDKKERSSEG